MSASASLKCSAKFNDCEKLETAIRSKIRSIGADKIDEIRFIFGRSVDGFYVKIELIPKKEPESKFKTVETQCNFSATAEPLECISIEYFVKGKQRTIAIQTRSPNKK